MASAAIEQARFNMVEQQIRPWEVFNPQVLDLLAELPREEFVPPAYRGLAYADLEIPLPNGQRMLSPCLVAKLLQALALAPGERVLEVGSGSGFVTACLARLGGRVTSLELDPVLSALTASHLERVGVSGVEQLTGDLFHTELAPRSFDAIALTGAVRELPEELIRLLDDHGRIFAVLGEEPIMQAFQIQRNSDGTLRHQVLFDTLIPSLKQPQQQRKFIF